MPEFSQQKKSNNKNKESDTASRLHSFNIHKRTENPLCAQQEILGNQAVQHLLESKIIQPKLKVSSPGDKYEREADRVAEMVVRTSNHTSLQQVSSTVDSQVREQTATPSAAQSASIPDSVKAVINSGHGRSLDNSTRKYMEPRLGGQDFSQVRIHTNTSAAETARMLGALAFTVGRDIGFAKGQYAPGSTAGDRLLAHELAHVMQQRFGKHSKEIYRFKDPRRWIYATEIKWNKDHGVKFTPQLARKLFRVSKDREAFEAVMATQEIDYNFVMLVYSAQRVLFLPFTEEKMVDGKLGDKTIRRIDAYLELQENPEAAEARERFAVEYAYEETLVSPPRWPDLEDSPYMVDYTFETQRDFEIFEAKVKDIFLTQGKPTIEIIHRGELATYKLEGVREYTCRDTPSIDLSIRRWETVIWRLDGSADKAFDAFSRLSTLERQLSEQEKRTSWSNRWPPWTEEGKMWRQLTQDRDQTKGRLYRILHAFEVHRSFAEKLLIWLEQLLQAASIRDAEKVTPVVPIPAEEESPASPTPKRRRRSPPKRRRKRPKR